MTEGDFREHLKAAFPTVAASCPPVSKVLACDEGRLHPVERQAVEAHIEGCASCRSTIEDLRAFFAPGEELPGPEMEKDWSSLRERLRNDEPRRRLIPMPARPNKWPAFASIAAALLLITTAIASWTAWNQKRRIDTLERELTRRSAPLQRDHEGAPPSGSSSKAEPRLNAVVVDLYPRGVTDRSASASNTPRIRVAANSVAVLVLYVRDTPLSDAYAAEILNAAGAVVWAGAGLRPIGDGTVTMSIPGAFLMDGEYTLRLSAEGRSGRRQVAVYRLEWRRS